jgi:hypothetical protein
MERIRSKKKSDPECEDRGEQCVKWSVRRERLYKKIKEQGKEKIKDKRKQ